MPAGILLLLEPLFAFGRFFCDFLLTKIVICVFFFRCSTPLPKSRDTLGIEAGNIDVQCTPIGPEGAFLRDEVDQTEDQCCPYHLQAYGSECNSGKHAACCSGFCNPESLTCDVYPESFRKTCLGYGEICVTGEENMATGEKWKAVCFAARR